MKTNASSRVKRRRIRPVRAFAIVALGAFLVSHGRCQDDDMPDAPESAETSEDKEPMRGSFTLLNLATRELPIVCRLGDRVITPTEEALPPGFSTGELPWRPAKGELRAEAPGFSPAVLPPFLEEGESALILLNQPSATSLVFKRMPRSENESEKYYEGVNLTPAPVLDVVVEGKAVKMPRAKRVALGTENNLSFTLPGGGQEKLRSMFGGRFLVVFFADAKGVTKYAVVQDSGS